MLEDLPRNYFGAILADPPWHFAVWSLDTTGKSRHASEHYPTMTIEQIASLPIGELAAPDCSLFLWTTWPMLVDALEVIKRWGFTYKTCAFDWTKARIDQFEMFEQAEPHMGMGYWTRQNSEPCLLATRGRPRRLAANVRQAILEPRREHSRKPDCIYGRIECLVAGPYLELFARARRRGWYAWGNEIDKFGASYDGADDFAKSIDECYRAVRERKAAGGKGWPE